MPRRTQTSRAVRSSTGSLNHGRNHRARHVHARNQFAKLAECLQTLLGSRWHHSHRYFRHKSVKNSNIKMLAMTAVALRTKAFITNAIRVLATITVRARAVGHATEPATSARCLAKGRTPVAVIAMAPVSARALATEPATSAQCDRTLETARVLVTAGAPAVETEPTVDRTRLLRSHEPSWKPCYKRLRSAALSRHAKQRWKTIGVSACGKRDCPGESDLT